MKKVALITGASTGIGKELAHIHAENGGDLILVARRQDKLETLKKELENSHKIEALVIAKDLAAQTAAKEIYNEISKAGITVEYVINNAGFGTQGSVEETTLEDARYQFDVNLFGLARQYFDGKNSRPARL